MNNNEISLANKFSIKERKKKQTALVKIQDSSLNQSKSKRSLAELYDHKLFLFFTI